LQCAGANEVINNQFYDYGDNANYEIKGGPSTRRIVDFSDVENSWSILPTGQSEIHSVRIIKIKRNYTIQEILENENEQRGNHKIFEQN
jgi:hypothetical protein